jgi:hypothetical protein
MASVWPFKKCGTAVRQLYIWHSAAAGVWYLSLAYQGMDFTL